MSLVNELKKVVQLAWPLLIAQLTQTLMGVADTIMAGRYAPEDMAAVAIGYSITLPVLFFIQGLIFALPPIISRLHGSKREHEIANATQQTFWLVFPFSILIVACTPLVSSIFEWTGMDQGLRLITTEYVSYILYSAPVFCAYQVLRNFCEGLSVTRPTMLIMLIGLVVNIPANYVLIYGKFGVPAMGGAGCGLATAIVFCCMFVATWFYISQSGKLARYTLFATFYRPDFAFQKDILKLGFPIAMTILFEVTLFGVVALLLSPLGANVVAAHQIALNFTSLMFMFPLSIGMATSIRVGYLLGQNQLQQCRSAIHSAILLGLSIAIFTAIITITARILIARLYTTDEVVIGIAANLMFLAALFQFSDAVQVISAGALRGYKDTKAMFYITFVAYWLIGLPIGYLSAMTETFGTPLGAAGFWIGFIVGLTCAAVMLGIRLKKVQRHIEQTLPA